MTNSSSYREIRMIRVALAGRELALAFRPAIEERTALWPYEELLMLEPALQEGQRVLVSPSGIGAVAAWAAQIVGPDHVVAMDTSAIALELSRRTLTENGLSAEVRAGLPAQDESFDVALLAMPKGRQLSRLHVLRAALALAPGGQLYVAGANSAGIKSVLVDCERLLGPGALLAYRKGQRIARFVRGDTDAAHLPAPYDEPGLLEGTWLRYAVPMGEASLQVCSRPGVFSHGELDAGTALLARKLSIAAGMRILDVGCGAGIIGAIAARIAGPEQVTLTDDDLLACDCAHATLAANDLDGAEVCHADMLSAVSGRSFEHIVSNPPFHAGHAVNLSMTAHLIDAAYQALVPGGLLTIVANRFLPYDHLLQEQFGQVSVIAENSRYRVLSATRSMRHKR